MYIYIYIHIYTYIYIYVCRHRRFCLANSQQMCSQTLFVHVVQPTDVRAVPCQEVRPGGRRLYS